MKKFLKGLIILILLIGIGIAGAFLFLGKSQAEQLDNKKPLAQLVANAQSSADYTPYDQIAPFLLNATVAVEDARFYSHGAVDLIGLARGMISQFIPGMSKSGGSSISQQVVKNLYGQFDAGIEWKAAEIRLAYELESMLSKDEILALYVNVINYGDNHIGITKASWGYFNYSPGQLSDAEAAILAGIPQNPSWYQLSNHAEAAKSKQEVVLNAMVRNGYIDQQQADSIALEPVEYFANQQWNVVYGLQAHQFDPADFLLIPC